MKEVCLDDEADNNEEGLLINSNDKAVSCYSNNSVKRFYKMPIGGNLKKHIF